MKNIREFVLLIAGRSMMARLAASVTGIALLLSLSSAPMAQTVNTIDFETVPGGTPTEGLHINTQFEATTGISFSLEGGGDPHIAQVGSPATAFKGPPGGTGDDNVAPGSVAVGQFFLTDDGVTTPGPTQPLIIDFSSPVSSVSGVLIDVDFDEAFSFQARDSGGATLTTVSLAAGDPGTGDGAVTPWTIDQGANEIFSLRIEGTHTSGGGFAFDNLTAFSLIQEALDGAVPGFTAGDLLNSNFGPYASFNDPSVAFLTESSLIIRRFDQSITQASAACDGGDDGACKSLETAFNTTTAGLGDIAPAAGGGDSTGQRYGIPSPSETNLAVNQILTAMKRAAGGEVGVTAPAAGGVQPPRPASEATPQTTEAEDIAQAVPSPFDIPPGYTGATYDPVTGLWHGPAQSMVVFPEGPPMVYSITPLVPEPDFGASPETPTTTPPSAVGSSVAGGGVQPPRPASEATPQTTSPFVSGNVPPGVPGSPRVLTVPLHLRISTDSADLLFRGKDPFYLVRELPIGTAPLLNAVNTQNRLDMGLDSVIPELAAIVVIASIRRTETYAAAGDGRGRTR